SALPSFPTRRSSDLAAGGLVQEGDAISGKELALTAGAAESHGEVFAGVLGGERVDGEPAREPRVERAASAETETRLEVAETDEHEREERLGIPLVVEQDVQVIEGVLMKEVDLVEQEDGVEPLLREILHTLTDGIEHRSTLMEGSASLAPLSTTATSACRTDLERTTDALLMHP